MTYDTLNRVTLKNLPWYNGTWHNAASPGIADGIEDVGYFYRGAERLRADDLR